MTGEQDAYQRSYENVPGMQEALKTFEQPKPGPRPLGQLKDAILTIDGHLNVLAHAAATTIFNPAVLVTALPLVQNMRLNNALEELSTIPEGRELVDLIKKNGTELKLDPSPLYMGGRAGNIHGVSSKDGYQLSPGTVVVAGFATRGEIVGVLAHELQHHRQNVTKTLEPFSQTIPSPIEQLWFNRCIEADAQATAVDIAWKLKEAGKPKTWNAMKEDLSAFGKIARAYGKAVKHDPESVKDGSAKRVAYDEWFIARVNDFAPTLSQIYNRQGLNNNLIPHHVDQMVKEGREFAPMDVSNIEKLGDLSPLTPNYLKLPGFKPLDDPFYRAADWGPNIASGLKNMHDRYDDVLKTQAKSKFLSPANPETPAAPVAEAKATLQTTAAVKRAPALKM